MALTNQQEAFAQAVASGKSRSDAYREAYRAGKMAEKTIHESASRIAADRKVTTRISELKAELAEIGLWARVDSVRALIRVVNNPDKASDIVAAVKALNEMHGFDAPKKVNVSGDISLITRRIVDVGSND